MSGTTCMDRGKIIAHYRGMLPFSVEGMKGTVVGVYIKEGVDPVLIAVTDTGAAAKGPVNILSLRVD